MMIDRQWHDAVGIIIIIIAFRLSADRHEKQ